MENLHGGHNNPKTPTIKYLGGKVLPVGIGRGRFEAPIPLSPVFDPYFSFESPNSPSSLSPFFRRSGSGVPFDLSDGSGSRGIGFRSPLASMENLVPQPSRSPIASVFGTPVKVEEDVIVMDGILVKQKGGGTRSRGTPSDSGDKNSFYKRDMCLFWEESGTCRLGSKCQFAHGQEELRPARHTSKICKSFHLGSCSYGTKCRFVHPQEPMEVNSAVLSPAAGAKVGFPVTHTESQQPAASGGNNLTSTSASCFAAQASGWSNITSTSGSCFAAQASGWNNSTSKSTSSSAAQASGENNSTSTSASSAAAAQASRWNNRTSTSASSSAAAQASGGNNRTSTSASFSAGAQASGGNDSTSTSASSSATHTKSQQLARGGNNSTSTSTFSVAAQASVNTGWSPLDDGIMITLPEKAPIEESVDAYIQRVLYGPSSRKRLPAFVEICPE